MSAKLDRLCCGELVQHARAVERRKQWMLAPEGDLPRTLRSRTPAVLAWLDAADAGDECLQAIEYERELLRDEAEAYELAARIGERYG